MIDLDKKLGQTLVSDELFDLTLYKRMLDFAGAGEKEILNKLIPIETRHLAAWQSFFKIPTAELGLGRKIKLSILLLIARISGSAGIHLILQAIEIHGIKKYLAAWERYKNDPLGAEIKNVLQDEFEHEDQIVSSAKRTKIYPERVRDIFLGFNDGLVEILGAVSGFFAAFSNNASVLIAALTVAVAGSISMAASAFAAQSSQREVENTEIGKKRFLGETVLEVLGASPLRSATVVGIFYFVGSLVPILPVIFGATNPLYSIIVAGIIIIAVSYIVAFLSGMDAGKRIATNIIIIAIAVTVTYALASFAKSFFDIAI
ncbi:hypothetical protein A3I27_01170 [Candidatus Giovannonibacteria bacterium RIFCSPLOWO2_02_FULL_43_11b]|nr:MAG: hypothetical protein A2739_02920 [Candidatus Giovannonibacteria bacterium RIFCSPHIGHO2_01_FULL_43_100]OGF67121.1 MAG: hypothetical protein A3B97_04280 [Candidatus Giovannonibacteria bacterium RIFCSPHIGHO2_02_FULL_43_32]OGF79319.1 MAG: hypothetical protein A3A15_01625 [Candidatus Giovannonibacteria bacterium RIFCSPLOWO2_01_FULL_43_60]OGF90593.1 MAG: hypothetical protein A3I27_01170 [Candidatus Giovannonibacteria bacterium RIFCSPLOWO2_02_FULL_43_11b]OGF91936.1 MAG: hypothetical protein A3